MQQEQEALPLEEFNLFDTHQQFNRTRAGGGEGKR